MTSDYLTSDALRWIFMLVNICNTKKHLKSNRAFGQMKIVFRVVLRDAVLPKCRPDTHRILGVFLRRKTSAERS